MTTHREFQFAKVPDGLPTEDCFKLVEAAIPQPAGGEVLVRTDYLSMDPYMRRAMGGSAHYGGMKPGAVMIGRGAGTVIESRHPDFVQGDTVQAEFGWREHVVLKGAGLRKLASDLQPLSLSLGIVGQSAATAYVGLHEIAGIRQGETVVVSAAAGAVGSAVGQISRIRGCRVVGIAGGPDKCRHAIDDLGFDDCIDYKAGDLTSTLGAAVPEGIDIYFDNVGGETLNAALAHINEHARVPVCGQISQYNSTKPVPLHDPRVFLDKSMMIRGFRIASHLERRDEALDVLLGWWRDGKLDYRETVSDGFETAPAALINMLTGGNYGKQVVKVAND